MSNGQQGVGSRLGTLCNSVSNTAAPAAAAPAELDDGGMVSPLGTALKTDFFDFNGTLNS
jgi:hypothetical protein